MKVSDYKAPAGDSDFTYMIADNENLIYRTDKDGNVVAQISFPETSPGVFTIDHTIVDESLSGQGIAGTLVKLAVEEIKRRGGQVEATCSYAERWLEKHRDQL